jgi:adenine-specific DNA-methyltransferase
VVAVIARGDERGGGALARTKTVAVASQSSALTNADAVRLELSRARTLARAWAKTIPEARRADHAALFARAAMVAFGEHAEPTFAPSSPVAVPHGALDVAALGLARGIGALAASLQLVEGAHSITGLYTTLLPDHQRGSLGAFYTPPALAERLLDMAGEAGVDWRTARILDPACGGGAFLLPAAKRLIEALGDCAPALVLKQIGTRLLGLELDPYAADLAQTALEILLTDLSRRAGKPIPKLVRIVDTLEETPKADFDLVIGNPPYGRVGLTPEQRQRFARSLYGHANLYGVFTDIALRWTRPGGLIAYLTPTSFLAGQYFSALRGLLAKEAPPIAFDFVHARSGVFEGVLQETLLAVYKRGAKPGRAEVHYLTVSSEREAEVRRNGTVGLPRTLRAPWMAPREPEHSALIAHVETMASRLSDLGYRVSTGPLVWNRFKNQLRRQRSKGALPLIWAEAVTSDGRFVFRADRRNHEPYFKLEPGDGWLRVDTPCVLLQRTTAKEQSRRLICAELPAAFIEEHGGVVVENHLNMILPVGRPRVSARVIAALLNSQVVDQVFRCISGSVAVSAFELEALPLPSPTALGALEGLVACAPRNQIEAAIAALYK